MERCTRLVLVRHGETAWNVGLRIQGHTDIPLNAVGRWQAERVAAALADEGLNAIYSSDLQRAAHTADAIGRVAGLAAQRDVALRERAFGEFEGASFTEIEARWPEAARRWRAREPDFQPGGGESLNVFSERCVAVAHRLAAAHPGQTIALVAHGGVLDCLYRAATGLAVDAPRSWQLGNATVNRLLYTGEGLTLVGWNDSAHLALGAGVDGPPPADV